MNNSNKALDILVDKFKYMLEEFRRSLKFDKTFKTTIWGKNSDGTYQISYMNQKYNVPNLSGINLQLGQSVWVTIPSGIFRNMYISDAKGTIASSGTSEETSQEVIDHMNDSTIHVTQTDKNLWNSLADKVEDLLYKKIAINSFTISPALAQFGTTVTQVQLKWGFNNIPETLTLNDVTYDVTSTGDTLTDLNITSDTSYVLKATDERDATATSTKTLQFCNYVMYGTATVDTGGNLTIVSSNDKLSLKHLTSFTVTASTNEYIFYAVPSRLGTAYFSCGGFDGGVTLFKTQSQLFNGSTYVENYDYYLSDNHSLGTQTISVRTSK